MPMGLDSVIVTPTGHRFFFQLVTAQAATAAYLSGTMAELQDAWHSWPDDSPISQLCFTRNLEVQFQPSEVLRPISRNAWPSGFDHDSGCHLNVSVRSSFDTLCAGEILRRRIDVGVNWLPTRGVYRGGRHRPQQPLAFFVRGWKHPPHIRSGSLDIAEARRN
jgi:hypothetical protein